MTARRVHVLGASGSGTTTLGRALASALGLPAFDADHYYWEPTDPPFQVKRPMPARALRLLDDLRPHSGWVLSGSLVSWDAEVRPLFSHVVFVWLPEEVRLARLLARERTRHGARIEPGGDMAGTHVEFMAWARRYDTAGMEQRSRALHERWLASLTVPVVRVEGVVTVEEAVARVRARLD